MDVKPDDLRDSLLLYAGENPDGTGDFISLVILNGGYELRIDSDAGKNQAFSFVIEPYELSNQFIWKSQ